MEKKEPGERWHGAHHYSDKVHLFFVLFLFLAIGTLLWSYFELSGTKFSYKNSSAQAPSLTLTPSFTPTPTVELRKVFCTQEAKQCPDGSYVGRTGPKCEFSACPKAIFCGGIAGVKCHNGQRCQLDGTYPDAGGKCVKIDK